VNLRSLYNKNKQYVLSLYIAVVPVFFIWHTELIFEYNGMNLSNGFARFDGLQIYHILMYMMLIGNFAASLYLMRSSK